MNQILKYIITAAILWASITASGQSFGVRAGLNYSTFNGPSENANESFGVGGGFHFGVNYSYHVTDLFSVVFELGYTQNGASYSYNGDSYYVVRSENVTKVVPGTRDMNLTISNGYLMFPVLANFKLTDKIEVFGGAYANLLASPTGRGELIFRQYDIEEEFNHVEFKQSLDYNFRSDNALAAATFANQRPIGVWIAGEDEYFAKVSGAYHHLAEKRANLMNSIDAGLVGGFNYFLNKGFYAGLRLEYGLTDITDDRVDVSYSSLDPNNNPIYRADRDSHFGVNVSVGFRF